MRALPLLALVALGSACDGTVRLAVTSSSDLLGNRTQVTVTDRDGTERFVGEPPEGIFEVAIAPGAQVAIMNPSSSSPTAQSSSTTTITGLQPGDFVDMIGQRVGPSQEPLADMTLTYPELTGVDPLTVYVFVTPCGDARGGAGVARLTFMVGCVPAGPFDVLGHAVSTDATQARRFTAVRGVTYAAGATIAAPTWQAMPRLAVTVRGLTDETALAVRHRDVRGLIVARSATIDPPSGTVTVELDAIPTMGTTAFMEVATARTGAIGVQRRQFVVAANPLALDVDLAATPFVWITGGPHATGDGAAWTQTGEVTPDAAVLSYRSGCTGGPPYSCFSGVVYGPGDAAFLPAGPAATLRLVDHPSVDGYAEVRQGLGVLGAPLAIGEVVLAAEAPASVDD